MAGPAVLIDYGAGNLRSVHKALQAAGMDVRVTAEPHEADGARALILPGQGHFGQVMRSFEKSGFEPVVREHLAAGKPFLGICVGLQLLLEGSEEAPDAEGLGVLPGLVRRYPRGHRVPQMGWNRIRKLGRAPLLEGVEDGAHVYFANSYYAELQTHFPDASGAVSNYAGISFASAFSNGNLHATQFHPEKSQRVGLTILGNFARIAARSAA